MESIINLGPKNEKLKESKKWKFAFAPIIIAYIILGFTAIALVVQKKY